MQQVEKVWRWIWEFFLSALEHQAALFVLGILALFLLVIGKQVILERLDHVYNKMCTKIHTVFLRWATRNTVQLKHDYDKTIAKIMKDTARNVMKLRDRRQAYVAIQYLLEYPSPKGYLALIAAVVREEKSDIRNKLLWLMHKRASICWYKEVF